MSSFTKLPLLPTLLSTLAEKEFVTPTEIQRRAIPALLEGKTIVGLSQTGSGKTLAYALPLLHMMKTLEIEGNAITEASQPRAAVLVPTRELGEQISKVLKPFTHSTRVRVRTVLGGTAMDVAKRNVNGAFEILVATPGRLVQLMDQNLVKMNDVRVLVFDEADQMLDQGFLNDAKKISDACAPKHQLALFSATVSATIEGLITQLFANAEMIEAEGSHKVVPTLTTINQTVLEGKRYPVLEKILAKPSQGGTLIFTNTREQCDTLAALMDKKGFECLIYRGEMDKVERKNNLKAFREGKIKYLISTDLAARGLDVEHVERVINYHLPKELDNYIHRVGRTARAGRKGEVINLITERDAPLIKKLEKIQSSAPKRK